MSPAKNEGSSCRKGKEVITNDPLAKTVGKEAPFSKSDHSKVEEGGYNPNSECLPLINSWFDAQIHFLVVLNDYLPLLPTHVWLSICHRDTEVSWVPLASSIPDLDICQGTSLLVPILFEIWIRYLFGLEGVGRRKAVQHRFHGGVVAGRHVEARYFVLLLIQL